MWDQNRTTTTSCHINYLNIESHETYPLYILEKMDKLYNALREWGVNPGMVVCGSKIDFHSGGDHYEFLPYNDSGPWKNIITTRSYSDKGLVISIMCTLIVLQNEDYIYQVTVSGIDKDGENKELWQTAWSIVADMETKEHEHKKHLANI